MISESSHDAKADSLTTVPKESSNSEVKPKSKKLKEE